MNDQFNDQRDDQQDLQNNLQQDFQQDLPQQPSQAADSDASTVSENTVASIEDTTGDIGDESGYEASPPARSFEDLSLLEALRIFLRQPFSTLAAFSSTLSRPVVKAGAGGNTGRAASREFYVAEVDDKPFNLNEWLSATWAKLLPVVPLLLALIVTIGGSVLMQMSNTDPNEHGGLKFSGLIMLFGAAVMVYIMARGWTMTQLPRLEPPLPEVPVNSMETFIRSYSIRIALFGVSLLWTAGSWVFSSGNQFTGIGVFCWIMSILTMGAALLDRDLYLASWISRRLTGMRSLISRTVTVRFSLTILALIIILIVGAVYRFSSLSTVPPDMTSDHVEKLLDSIKVYEGQRPIFFPNNGGRESFQMYYLAALKSMTGLPFNYDLLKIGTGLEGMLTILLAYWMGRALIGDEDPALGNLTGVIMAAMIAVSYWHTLLSRLGLRIVTTTLVVSVAIIYFARALRNNRRSDYLITGFVLGAGMYFYQAVRMLPLVMIAGIVIALIVRARSWRIAQQYLFNFIALVAMSLVVFVPLAHYSVENPGTFLERTTGRLFGDPYKIDPDTHVVTFASPQQQMENFQKNLPLLGETMTSSLLMFNWRGDISWFNGSPDGLPAMDFFTGALFILGLAIFVVRIIKRRDPVDLLIPVSIVIMLLPSALALAHTIEVPGFTRASGALPMAYFVAAFALATIIRLIALRVEPGWPRRILYATLIVLLGLGAVNNANAYFVMAQRDYRESTQPHHQAGQILRGFINSTGAAGNAVMVSYKYWWDNRAVGIEAGDPKWSNTIAETDNLEDRILDLFRANLGTRYELKADRQLLFFINKNDAPSQQVLKGMFPNGTMLQYQAVGYPAGYHDRDFDAYVVPPVGCDWVYNRLGVATQSCPQPAPAGPTGQGQGQTAPPTTP